MAHVLKLQPSFTCLFNEGLPKHSLIFMVRRNLEWRPSFGNQSFVNKNDPPFIPISYVMVLLALFSLWVSQQSACQSRDKGEQDCLSCATSLSTFKQRSTWMGTACARLNVVLCLFLGEQQLLPHDGMNVHEQDCFRWVFQFYAGTSRFHQEPCTSMKWQAMAETTAGHHDRPRSTEHGKLTKKTSIENKYFWIFFCLFFFFLLAK